MADSRPIGSVVIPAHNEALVIRRCLDVLLAGFAPGEIDVLVSCNGCTDGTADIVRSSWPSVRVIEVPQASKVAALRAADEILHAFPRIYLDADVVLSSESARLVMERLANGPALAARPPISYDTEDCAPLVRSYYRARMRVPSVMNSLWGAGVYGLSALGRGRFGSFPELIADDLFVDQRFQRPEIEIVQTPPVVVRVPRRTADLFRVLRRTYQGNEQNRALPGGQESTARSTARDLLAVTAADPAMLMDSAVYLGMAFAARVTLKLSTPVAWSRDESSRTA